MKVLDKLDVIECLENLDDKHRVGEVPSKQNQLYLNLIVSFDLLYQLQKTYS